MKYLQAQLDYVIVRKSDVAKLVKSRSLRNAIFYSDHLPVIAVFNESLHRRRAIPTAPRPDSSALHEEQTKELYKQKVLDGLIKRAKEGETDADSLTTVIKTAAEESLPKTERARKTSRMSVTAQDIYSRLCAARHQKDHHQERRLRRGLRRQLQYDRDEMWEQRAKEIEAAWSEKNPRKVYTLLRMYSGKLSTATRLIRDAGRTVYGENSIPVWQKYFEDLLNRDAPMCPQLPLHRSPAYSCSTAPPSQQEVEDAVRKLKNNKAAGDDGISAEMLKSLPTSGKYALVEVLTDIWRRRKIPDSWRMAVIIPLFKKGSRTEVSNYRGISLLRTMYKILERIILARLIKFRENTTRDEQAGFRGGRSTVDQIFILRRLLETRYSHGQETHIAFLDFASAFDSPDRKRLFDLLRADGVPEEVTALLEDMNKESTATVRTAFGTTKPFSVKTGVRQGSVAGPFLFNYVVDDVMKRVSEDCSPATVTIWPTERPLLDLEYADDVALIANSTRELQKAVNATSEYAAAYGLLLRPEKCKYMWCTTKPSESLRINGKEIELVEEFCYLGSTLRSNCDVSQDVEQRIRKATAAFNSLSKSLWKSPVSNKVKLRVYLTAIRPILLYSSETWPLNPALESKIDTVERRFMRRILGYFWPNRRHNYQLYEDVDKIYRSLHKNKKHRLPRPSEAVAAGRLRLLGHTMRRPHDRLTQKALRMLPDPAWKKTRGRKRLSWKEAVRKDVEKTSIGVQLKKTRDTITRQLWNSEEWMETLVPYVADRKIWSNSILGYENG